MVRFEKIKFEVKTLNTTVGNFPSSMAAIPYIARTVQKEEKMTDEEAEKLKKKMEEELVETMEAMEEEEMEVEEEDEDKLNVFLRDKTGIYIEERHVKGWLKEHFRILKMRGYREAINHGVYVFPYGDSFVGNEKFKIYLTRDGKVIREPDGILKRPIQVMTPKGGRSSYKLLEYLEPPVEFSFVIEVVDSVSRKLFTKEILKTMGYIMGNIGFLGDRSLGMGKCEVKVEKIGGGE